MISRRNFLKNTGLLAGISPLLAGQLAYAAATQPEGDTPKAISTALKGKLYTLGIDGHFFPGVAVSNFNHVSILTAVDLDTGAIKQTPVNVGNGHSVVCLDSNRILCVPQDQAKAVMVDGDHKEIMTLTATDGYLYDGHALAVADENIFILSLKKQGATTLADQGIFEIYDLKSGKLVDHFSSDGIHPHEMHVLKKTNELVATHYGDIRVPHEIFQHNVIDSKVSVYDLKTFKVKRHYDQNDMQAMATHMNVSPDGNAYFVMTQYIKPQQLVGVVPGSYTDDRSPSRAQSLALSDALLEKHLGHPRTYPLPYEAGMDMLLPVPLAFVKVNLQTGERQAMMTSEANHLRSQSVAYHEGTGTAIGVYYHSNTLVLSQEGKEPEVVHGDDLGLSELRGIAPLPGTDYIALAGAYRGLTIYDLKKRDVVKHLVVQHFNTVHLTYAPA